VIGTPCSSRGCVLYLDGTLRTPVDRGLRHSVRALLRRGQRRVVLDLSRVLRIDAAGISELVRAYNMATATQGVLRIVHATPWVRQILERVGLFDILSERS
jgi:anti-anti-sigma factor